MGNATDAGYLLAPDACQHGLMQIATMPQCTEATVTEASDIDSLKSFFFLKLLLRISEMTSSGPN